ncbi:hypothetical protein BGZ76_009627 [Entomortierella beljakovae]|nr:hypothetical protein BGZ76_009627 [Entomortierella beljakovae]
MFKSDSFISFHDLSSLAIILWVSPSIYDILGYTPEELQGLTVYDLIVPEDRPLSRVVHKENMMNDLIASQVILMSQPW